MRQINQAGIDLIKEFEGLRTKAYKDPVGIWTIGYGHTETAKRGMTVTPEQAEDLLRRDLYTAESAVNRLVTVPLSDNQFAALVSFVFNVGEGAFRGSTLLRRLNAGNYGAVPDQLKRWNRAGGRVLNGLVRRREDEARLWSTPDAS